MRLYLSSFRLGAGADHLRTLAGGSGRTAVIANAMDAQSTEQRRDGVQRELDSLAELGLNPEELDLRDFFDCTDAGVAITNYDLVWLRGGNVFMLRHALAKSGADTAISELLAADAITYGGYSAGPCVLGGPLDEFASVDDPRRVTAAYGEPAPTTGLGVLDWIFVPHVDSPGHPETEACGLVAQRYSQRGIAVRTFRDGEVLIIDGTSERYCGES